DPARPYNTVERLMYNKVDLKDRYIRRMMRIMKRTAIDCQSHINRNVRPGGVDGSAACDYSTCSYTCIDQPLSGPLDTSTYDVYYIDEIVQKTVDLLIDYFKDHSSGDINDFVKNIPSVEKQKYFYFALEYMISKNVKLQDRFGFSSYVREDNGLFY